MTPVYFSEKDKENEAAVVGILSKKWNCTFHSFGMYFPIDFYALRDNKMVGVIEIKTRNKSSRDYSYVFLALRKWISLGLVQNGLGVPAIFVVQFTDRLMFIPFDKIDAKRFEVGGRKDRNGGGGNDLEPLIKVDIAEMKDVDESTSLK